MLLIHVLYLVNVLQEEYSAAHQCFITENSLYVLCWRVTDGEDGIQEMKDWLVTIKVNKCRPSNDVIWYPTHRLDGMVTYFRISVLYFQNQIRCQNALRQGSPLANRVENHLRVFCY